MKILIALLLAVPCFAATHVSDTVYLSDGITPVPFGYINVQGFQRSVNGKTALTSTIKVPIGGRGGGVVDFQLEGGVNTYFQATVYITQSDGKTVISSYQEPPWTVPDTGTTLTIRDIRAAAVPASIYLKAGSYCVTVSPPAWAVVSNTVCGGGSGGTLFDSVSGLFDSALGLFDAH
jgi:hypothetical protein